MKRAFLTASLLGTALLSSAAMAQTSPAPAAQPNASTASTFLTRLEPGQMLASEVMDEDIVGTGDEDVGEIEDIVLDRNGRVVAFVVEVDEGIGDRTVALPMNMIQMPGADAATTGSVQGSGQTGAPARRDDDMRFVVTVPMDQLKAAPEFDDDND